MALKDILPVEKIYDDLLSPSVKQVGLALESVFKTARFSVAPFDMAAALYDNRWQKFIKRISEKVEPQNIVEGQPQIVIPVLNALDLQQEDSLLSELFINLLSASIDSTKQHLAHPAFPNIINQLSHDEAVILYYLKKKDFYYYTEIELNKLEIPNHTRLLLKEYIFPVKGINNEAFFGLYFSHLKSLDLATSIKHHRDDIAKDTSIIVSDRFLLPFGILFANSCIPDEFEGL